MGKKKSGKKQPQPANKPKGKPKQKAEPMFSTRDMAPAAVGKKIPSSYIESYSVKGGIGFRGAENLGHFTVRAATAGSLQLVRELSVNPLNPILFPRTNMLARVFEQYAFKKLRFFYVPRAASTDSTSILQYFDYDPADPAATDDIQILSNMTRDSSVVWQSSAITVDMREMHRNRNSFFVQSPVSGVLDAAAIRQDYCGTWRCYAQTANAVESQTLNHGYLFVEYDLQLFVPRPPVEVVLTATPKPMGPLNTGSAVIPSNTSQAIALPYKQQAVGMNGGPNENGDISSLLSSTWGSLSNVYDAAKQVYSAGKWAFNLVADVAAAAADDDHKSGWTVLSDKKEIRSCIDCSYAVDYIEDDPDTLSREGRVRLFERARKKRGLSVGAAGGFAVSIQTWRLNGKPVPADWPLTNDPVSLGLTSQGSATWVYTSAGALARIGGTRRPTFTTDDGPIIARWIFDTDPAAGSSREVSLVQVTTTRVPDTLAVSG